MAERPDEEPKLTIRLTNTERATEGDRQAGEGQLINDAVAVRFEDDDFVPEVKMKIGQYLDCEIHDEAAQSQARIQYKPPRPNNLADHNPDAPSNAGNDSFLAAQDQPTNTAFNQIADSGQFAFDVSIKNGEAANDDNEDPEARVPRTRLGIYSNLNEQGPNSVLSKAVENIIHRNARFSPKEGNTPFITPDSPSEDDAGTRSHVFYSTLGSHPGQDFTLPSGLNSNNDIEVTIGQLRDVGLRLLLQASGEAYIPIDRSTEELSKARGVTTVAPGLARLGLRQRYNRFSATEILNAVNPDAVKRSLDTDLEGNSNSSYGNVNNPLVPFSGISSSLSSIIVGTLLVLTLSAIMQALAELFSVDIGVSNPLGNLADPSSDPGFNIIEDKRRRLGSFIPRKNEEQNVGTQFTAALIDLNGFINLLLDTRPFKYSKSVGRGLQVFFGLGDDFGGIVGGAATSVIEAPGYWNTILRALVRSTLDPISIIGNGIVGIGGGSVNVDAFERTQYDIDRITGPDGDPFAVLDFINVLKDSRLIKIMNIIAQIGYLSLLTNRRANEFAIDSIPDVVSGPNGGMDRINPAALVKKSRLSDLVTNAGLTAGQLAWGTSTLPSKYLQNSNLEVADAVFTGAAVGTSTIIYKLRKDLHRTGEKRIPGEVVKRIEDELEAYYVPFYFHDLRTNEIIALHAFLENVTDSINADYAETPGYGRIGNVYTYKNTVRTISLSFKIVSTNTDDFDQMWYKINKIAMFCFPQYTQGRQIGYTNEDGGEYKFIQPFSQVPGSTPLIRMRIGDVFKTNYSDFDLARLHGLGQGGFSTPNNSDLSSFKEDEEVIDKIVEISERQRRFEFEANETFFFGTSISVPGIGFTRPGDTGGVVLSPTTTGTGGGLGAVTAIGASVLNLDDNNEPQAITIGPNTRATVNTVVNPKIYDITLQTDPIQGEQTTYRIDLTRVAPGDLTTIKLDNVGIYAKAKGITRQEAIDLNFSTTERVQEIQEFFSAGRQGGSSDGSTQNVNPIFQAFKSTRGKGMPGVVKSLNFDWNDAIWETEALNSKAPRWITVQMEFAPVFEINPGLDVDGNMIGALYNVGEIMNKLKRNREEAAQGSPGSSNERTVSLGNRAQTRREDN